MYKQHFGFKELPFSIAPNPRFLYMSEQHSEALAHLIYGINSDGGFVLLTGEVGTGKTTICRCLLEQIPQTSYIAFILNPKMTVEELLATFCDELGIGYPDGNKSIKVFVDRINEYLLDAHARGRKTVLIIEEAQNLSADVLEQVRLLTNLETNRQKLLQVIMIGQPELKDMLLRPDLRQLSQRITARYHMGALTKDEADAYINHRLVVAGANNKIFPDSTIGTLHRLSRGIPRLVNVICDRALLGAYVQGKEKVDRRTLINAAHEVFGQKDMRKRRKNLLRWAVSSAAIVLCGAALSAAYYNYKAAVKTPGVPVREAKQALSVKVDTLQWPAGKSIEQSRDMAYGTLFKQWGVTYLPEGGSRVCRQAENNGLRCFQRRGNIGELVRLNRPAVLKIFDGGHEFYVAIMSIQDRTASLVIGDENQTVDTKEIDKKWNGDYVLLWRPPENYNIAIHPGYRGPEVLWLKGRLSLVHGVKLRNDQNNKYSEKLVNEVKKFQLAMGLAPDGIVGARTVILLNNVTAKDEPVLKRTGG